MSKKPVAAFVADIHWMTRTPEYRKETCPFHQVIGGKMAFLADYCRFNSIPAFVAGDLFDVSRDFMGLWTMRELLWEHFWPHGKEPVRLWIVPGQHDRFHHNPNEKATSLNALLTEQNELYLLPDYGVVLGTVENSIAVYGSGWGDGIPKVKPQDKFNVLVTHKTLWHKKPVYPGQTEGNVSVESVKYHELGYSTVFSGDNHRQFDVTVGGVEFHNLGAFTRQDVTLRDQQPRFCVLFDDMSVESVCVGEKDVFDLDRSDADKERENEKDGFSEALAGGFEYGSTFKGSLEKIVAEGKCGELVLNEQQRNLLRDINNSI